MTITSREIRGAEREKEEPQKTTSAIPALLMQDFSDFCYEVRETSPGARPGVIWCCITVLQPIFSKVTSSGL
jgi:hypothetical protein